MLILYGSETGTAEDVAELIGREAKRRLFHTRVMAMDTYARAKEGFLLPQETLVVFVVSTTGQGDPPENMKTCWRFLLRRELPPTSLQKLRFAVLGLGDSSYEKFNFMGKKLYRRLLQLGGQPIHRRGDADDQHRLGLFGELDPWLKELWDKLLALYPLPPGAEILPEGQLAPPKYTISFGDTSAAPTSNARRPQAPPYNQQNPFEATLLANRRLTASDWEQDVRHIELDISESGMAYEPGDILCVLPANLPDAVDEFLAAAQLDGNRVIARITPNRADVEPPAVDLPCTLRELVTRHLDVNAYPRRYFFEVLSFFADDALHQSKLRELSSAEGQDELIDYCVRPKRTAAEVLADFFSVRFPVEYLLDIIPSIKARQFSISSSLKVHTGRVHLSVAVVNYRTKLKKTRRGLCTAYLASLAPTPETTVRVWVKKGDVRPPRDPSKPVIMVGPGTGLALFKAFLEERSHLAKHGVAVGENTFYFGCRHEKKDYLYGDLWQDMVAQGHLHHLHTAFSRDQESKVYVQHRLLENAEHTWNALVNQHAHFYVSGSAKQMPKDIKAALKEICKTQGNKTEEEAEEFFQQLRREKRYLEDTWD